MEYDKWNYSVKQVPAGARKLCTFINYLERNGQMGVDGTNTVYYDENGYYMFTESSEGISMQVQMSDGAAEHILTFTGIVPSNDAQIFPQRGSSNAVIETVQPFDGFTYEGMLAASQENLIEIYKQGVLIQSISDNREIYNFLLALDFSAWTYAQTIPDAAADICTVMRYQAGRREHTGALLAQSRLLFYASDSGYYAEILTADNGSAHDSSLLAPQHWHVPAETGEMLSDR